MLERESGMTRFTVIREGRIVDDSGPLTPDQLEHLLDDVMSRLLKLRDIEDQDIGATLPTGEVALSVDVWANSLMKAVEIGDGGIRSALHAAGVSTPQWELIGVQVESSAEWHLVGGGLKIEPAVEELIDA